MNFAVVLAGGKGLRMGTDIPKQFLELDGIPVIVRTIKKILSVPDFDNLIIAIHPDYQTELLRLFKEHNINTEKINITNGGKERIDSIENALKLIYPLCKREDDVVVICDAVRPFVSEKILLSSIKTARDYGACVAVVPVIDTIYASDGNYITDFPDRQFLYNGQAPDSFRVSVIKKAIECLTEEERKTITGTVQICAAKGYKVKTIEGEYQNIKITTSNDLIIAENILRSKNESLCTKK